MCWKRLTQSHRMKVGRVWPSVYYVCIPFLCGGDMYILHATTKRKK